MFLLFLPWASFWETHYFVMHYPVLRPYLLHPALRGAISGLGVLDIFIAAGMLRRRPSANSPQTAQTRHA